MRFDFSVGLWVDPVAHTFAGATLAVAGLRRASPLATAVLLVGANAPDVDALAYFAAPFASLAFRRGMTHGVLALVLWPFLIVGLALAWDRLVRRRVRRDLEPARAGPLLGIAALAVLTHPTLDWLNNYGLRWLMPFDGTWFYGDAVFIIDPWLWLCLGSAPFLAYSGNRKSLLAWSAFWALASVLVLMTPLVPLVAQAVWLVLLSGIVVVRVLARRHVAPSRDLRAERGARWMLGVGTVYVVALVFADFAEHTALRRELARRGLGSIERLMVAPVPANPFAGEVVIATPSAYYLGNWHWLDEQKLLLAPAPIRRNETDPRYAAASATAEARRFLSWARFPYAVIEENGRGSSVTFLDARYHDTGRLFGPTVTLDPELRPVGSQ